jgi:type VI secretion system protein ImpL
MKKGLSFMVLRQVLAVIALIVLGLMIWFAGPLLAFGGFKPLASASLRVFSIGLLLVGLLLWLAEWSLSIVAVALL